MDNNNGIFIIVAFLLASIALKPFAGIESPVSIKEALKRCKAALSKVLKRH